MTHKVLITGGMGYLGGRLASYLVKEPDLEIYLTTHKIKPILPEWLTRGKVIHLDVTDDKKEFIKSCKETQSIIHLAALNEIESEANPEKAFIVNSLGTLKLLQAAKIAGIKRFIYFSTAHIYGTPLIGKITEQTIPRPDNPYAITHKAAEDFVLAAHDKKILCGIVLRLSNAFGAPIHDKINRWTLVVNDLCRQAVISRKIVLRSSGAQTRDFITIEDVTRAVSHFLHLPTGKYGDGLYNLGGEYQLKIIKMAKLISFRCNKVLGYTPEIVKQKPKEDETYQTFNYCIDKIKTTGFSLQGKVEDEIDDTLRFCQRAFGTRSKNSIHINNL